MSQSSFDTRGCLSAAGVAALRSAVPGAVPAELAAHVASCGRCQQRLLSVERVPRTGHVRTQPPWRNLVVLGAALLLVIVAMVVTALLVR